MDAVCKMSKKPTTWPCSARSCPLFWDCYLEYEKTTQKKPTNADRIRAMSDEELAEFLNYVQDFPCEACCGHLYWCRRNNAPEPICKYHFLDWLKQPADVDALVDSIPAADVIPVVRCKDCIHRYGAPGQPNIQCAQMHDDDFCSYGERRNDDAY